MDTNDIILEAHYLARRRALALEALHAAIDSDILDLTATGERRASLKASAVKAFTRYQEAQKAESVHRNAHAKI
jgi:hypothetical protein